MKYLQDDDLARWTAALSSELLANTGSSSSSNSSSSRHHHLQMSSSAIMSSSGGGRDSGRNSLGGGTTRRRLQGRLEAYSMKRAGNDKQYAQVLGKKFVEQIHEAQQQLADCKLKQQQQQQQDSKQQQQQQTQKQERVQKVIHRKRSQSVGGVEEAMLSNSRSNSPTRRNRKDETGEKAAAAEGPGDDVAVSGRKKEALPAEAMDAVPCKKRKRAVSFDTAVLSGPLRKKKQQQGHKQQQHQHQQHTAMMSGASVPTGLGDFTEQATRRLMTDLILTLNSSFPDYDFSSTKASDFTAVSVPVAVRRINERLSEWATISSSSGAGVGENGGDNFGCAASRIHNLWTAVDKSIRLTECQVYAYQPGTGEAGNNNSSTTTLLDDSYMEDDDDDDDDDDAQHVVADSDDEPLGVAGGGAACSSYRSSPPIVLWSFYYLFVNKNLKRILLFSCVETMKRQYMAYNNYYDAAAQDGGDDDEEDADNSSSNLPTYYYPSADAADTQDYIDLDPGAPTAGGIPVSSI